MVEFEIFQTGPIPPWPHFKLTYKEVNRIKDELKERKLWAA